MADFPVKPKLIVVTGAESTGKSALTIQLAKHYNCLFYSEYARDYIGMIHRHYEYHDLEKIAEKQILQYEEAMKAGSSFVFFDTWLIITQVWFEVVYHRKPSWLIPCIRNADISLFLVCDTDLEWKPDPLRENGGAMREKLQKTYIGYIKRYRFKFSLISGHGNQRLLNAVEAINNHAGIEVSG